MPLFQVVAAVPVGTAKRSCYTCDSATRSAYVRTHVDIEYEGELVICKTCAETIARTLGWAHKSSVDQTKERSRGLEEERKGLLIRIADLEKLETAVLEAIERQEERPVWEPIQTADEKKKLWNEFAAEVSS